MSKKYIKHYLPADERERLETFLSRRGEKKKMSESEKITPQAINGWRLSGNYPLHCRSYLKKLEK